MLPSRLQRPRVVWDCIYSYRSLGEGKGPHIVYSPMKSQHICQSYLHYRSCERVHRYIITSQFTIWCCRGGGRVTSRSPAALASGGRVNGSWRDRQGVPTLSPIDSELTHISIDVRDHSACWPRKIFCSLHHKMCIYGRNATDTHPVSLFHKNKNWLEISPLHLSSNDTLNPVDKRKCTY